MVLKSERVTQTKSLLFFVIKRMGFGVEMNFELEEVEMRVEEVGMGVEEEEEGIRCEVQWVEMSQLAQAVFPICPAVCNMDLHLSIVPLVSLLPVRTYHKYYKVDHFCGFSTPWPNDLFAHMHDRPLCTGLCIVVSHGYRLALGFVHYISHSFHRCIHLALEPEIELM